MPCCVVITARQSDLVVGTVAKSIGNTILLGGGQAALAGRSALMVRVRF